MLPLQGRTCTSTRLNTTPPSSANAAMRSPRCPLLPSQGSRMLQDIGQPCSSSAKATQPQEQPPSSPASQDVLLCPGQGLLPLPHPGVSFLTAPAVPRGALPALQHGERLSSTTSSRAVLAVSMVALGGLSPADGMLLCLFGDAQL